MSDDTVGVIDPITHRRVPPDIEPPVDPRIAERVAVVRDLRTQAERLRAIVDARRVAIETAKLNRDISNLQNELDAITSTQDVIDALPPTVNFFERPGVHIRPETPVLETTTTAGVQGTVSGTSRQPPSRKGAPSRESSSGEQGNTAVLNEVFPDLVANLPAAKVASAQALSDVGVSLQSSPKPGELAVFAPGQQFFQGGTLQPSSFVPSGFVSLSPFQQHEWLTYGTDPEGYVSRDDFIDVFTKMLPGATLPRF